MKKICKDSAIKMSLTFEAPIFLYDLHNGHDVISTCRQDVILMDMRSAVQLCVMHVLRLCIDNNVHVGLP